MNDEMRQQIAQALMQPSTADVRNTVAERGQFFPLGVYGDGSVRPAAPAWLDRMAKILSLQERPDPSQGDAFLMGGVPVMGSMPFAQRGALGSGGGRMPPDDFMAKLKAFGQFIEDQGTPIKMTPEAAQAELDAKLAALRGKMDDARNDPKRLALEAELQRIEDQVAKGRKP